MVEDRKGLSALVGDLMCHQEVRARFNRNPLAVAKDYKLNAVAKAALFRMEPAEIVRAIFEELSAYNLEELEFPRAGPEFWPLPGDPDAQYPSPMLFAFRFAPRSATIADGDFELYVYGQSFMPQDTKVEVYKAGGAGPLVVQNPRTSGTFRCSVVQATVTPPAVAGNYEVWVTSPATPHAPIGTNTVRVSTKVLRFT